MDNRLPSHTSKTKLPHQKQITLLLKIAWFRSRSGSHRVDVDVSDGRVDIDVRIDVDIRVDFDARVDIGVISTIEPYK